MDYFKKLNTMYQKNTNLKLYDELKFEYQQKIKFLTHLYNQMACLEKDLKLLKKNNTNSNGPNI